MKDDYHILKKYYGETFAKLCRATFPTILETPGVLVKIITEHFAPTHSLVEDLNANPESLSKFKNYIAELYQPKKTQPIVTPLTPEELMDRAGYILYPECQTDADVEKFRKYYSQEKNEVLCTFGSHRLETNRIWFAVKKNVHEIRRQDFLHPERQDEYGTSVISIQFARSNYRLNLSIKNRYNHSVKYPDATYSNNLDNIIPGLT